ncbi:nucleoid-associated protein [Weissella diestrammenae]|uniref:Nucleoid-associated protein n=1 Tax=Weissella diestrammenae TaxID=1162633 RepID=A0A7G9T5E3_9LACO|nr:nucleoid-associated protein [Weissella diestrammenae]MCM0583176.1 nucleoid-associated protein [Weissella diestrammenae]QNN75318.1 nucleoid-associated protein [Weissella diestrammenae]
MIIKHTILHILEKDAKNLLLSQNEMDINRPNLHDYLEKQIQKFNNGDFKTGQLMGNDYLAQVLDDSNNMNFGDKSARLAEKLFAVIESLPEVPGGDLLVIEFTDDDDDYFALFKVNFAPRFSHIVDYDDDVMVNQLVLNQAVLPGAGTTPDEGIIVNLMDGSYRLIEKSYRHEGQRIQYFSERFLEIEPAASVKKELQGIKQAVKHVADKFDVPMHEALATTQETIFENVSEFGTISTEKIANAVFGDNISAKEMYDDALSSREINHEIEVANPLKYQKKYATQKFKLDSGIEVFIPVEAYQNKDVIEFINQPDGTMTLMIKGIDDINSKFNG